MAEVSLELSRIHDWESFHEQSIETFGFPDFYGRNMDAWVNCLSHLPKGNGMCRFSLDSREYLTIHLAGFEQFTKRSPDISAALLSSATAVNHHLLLQGELPRLALILA